MADDGLVRNITTRIDGAIKHFNCEKNLHNFARSRLLNGRGGGGWVLSTKILELSSEW